MKSENHTTDELQQTRTILGGASDQMPPRATDGLVGTIILNHYRVIEELGHGGMSVVYKAAHTMLDQIVAIKVLHSHLAKNEQAIKRFRQEAQSACKLDHPGIVRVTDFGVMGDETPYLIMDFVKGRSLAEVIKDGPLESKRALRLTAQICEALQVAHANGVVHRDIKPSNVILVAEGTPEETIKLLDFGIAKIVTEDPSNLTHTGESLGSPPYMSPEQCSGGTLDGRSDIYSLGCLLFELLTGSTPFKGASIFETIHKQIVELTPSISSVRAGVANSTQLDELILKATAKNPAGRFASADQMCAAIKKLLASFDERSGLLTQYALHLRLFGQRGMAKPSLWMPILGVAVALLVVAGAVAFQWSQPLRTDQQASTSQISFKQIYLQGRKSMEMGQLQDARKQLLQASSYSGVVGEQDSEYQDCLKRLLVVDQKLGLKEEAAQISADIERVKKYFPSLGSISTNTLQIADLQLDHSTAEKKQQLSTLMANNADLYNLHMEPEKAEKWARKTIEFTEQNLSKNDRVLARGLGTLANAQIFNRNFDDATKTVQRELAIANSQQDPLLMGEAYTRLGKIDYQKARLLSQDPLNLAAITSVQKALYESALKDFQQAEATFTQQANTENPQTAECLMWQGMTMTALSQFDEAEKMLDRALPIDISSRGENNVHVGKIHFYLGELYLTRALTELRGKPDQYKDTLNKADQELTKAESIFEKQPLGNTDAMIFVAAANKRGTFKELLGDYKGAEQQFLYAFNTGIKNIPREAATTYSYEHLNKLYGEQHRNDESERLGKQFAAARNDMTITPARADDDDIEEPIDAKSE